MINVWAVSKLLEDTGVLTEDECKKAVPFCLTACSRLSPQLKEPKFEDEMAVITACAGLALYSYTLLQNSNSEDFSSFKAGDVTISRSASSSLESAVKFRDESLLGAAPFLTDIDFVFEAVDV